MVVEDPRRKAAGVGNRVVLTLDRASRWHLDAGSLVSLGVAPGLSKGVNLRLLIMGENRLTLSGDCSHASVTSFL